MPGKSGLMLLPHHLPLLHHVPLLPRSVYSSLYPSDERTSRMVLHPASLNPNPYPHPKQFVFFAGCAMPRWCCTLKTSTTQRRGTTATGIIIVTAGSNRSRWACTNHRRQRTRPYHHLHCEITPPRHRQHCHCLPHTKPAARLPRHPLHRLRRHP